MEGLGVHATVEPGGGTAVRFGPDATWLPPETRAEDLGEFYGGTDGDSEEGEARRAVFKAAIAGYFPGIEDLGIAPDQVGVRPKLWHPSVPSTPSSTSDFVVRLEPRSPGALGGAWINLFGIESPGLTSSFAIADHVARMVGEENAK